MIKVVHETDENVFEKVCNELMEQGYKLSSSSVGYVPDPYDCNYLMAIMIKEKVSPSITPVSHILPVRPGRAVIQSNPDLMILGIMVKVMHSS